MINKIKLLSISYLFLCIASTMHAMGEKDIRHKIRESYNASQMKDFNALLTYISKGMCFTLSNESLSQERKNEFILEMLTIFVRNLADYIKKTDNLIEKSLTIDKKTKNVINLVYTLTEKLSTLLAKAIQPSEIKTMNPEYSLIKRFLAQTQESFIQELHNAPRYNISQLEELLKRQIEERHSKLIPNMIDSIKNNDLQDFSFYIKEYVDTINILIKGIIIVSPFATESKEKLEQTKKYVHYLDDIVSTLTDKRCLIPPVSPVVPHKEEKRDSDNPLQQLQKTIQACLN